MCNPLAAVVAGSAILGAGATYASSKKAAKTAKASQRQAAQQAEAQAQRAESQFNKLNQKQPGIAALLSRNKTAASRGIGSSFLTGPAGITGLGQYLGGRPSLLGGG